MRFLYKIWSGYDGFTPDEMPQRMLPGDVLPLGWKSYLEAVEPRDEVWVYFYGPGTRHRGVYAKGTVQGIEPEGRQVLLRVREHATTAPLTDPVTTRRAAQTVAPRGRQVFLVPEDWATPADCDVDVAARSCASRACDRCRFWEALPRIEQDDFFRPPRLSEDGLTEYVPAYWVIPRRCWIPASQIDPRIRRTSDLFYRFKVGEAPLAYPLALGVYSSLVERGLSAFDCIIPIPLSPEKAERGEFHRTLALAGELARLLDANVLQALSLKTPVSKRTMRVWLGMSVWQFELAYANALQVDGDVGGLGRVLLVDDVGTDGSTLQCAFQRLRDANDEIDVVAATAGQMIKKAVVVDRDSLLR